MERAAREGLPGTRGSSAQLPPTALGGDLPPLPLPSPPPPQPLHPQSLLQRRAAWPQPRGRAGTRTSRGSSAPGPGGLRLPLPGRCSRAGLAAGSTRGAARAGGIAPQPGARSRPAPLLKGPGSGSGPGCSAGGAGDSSLQGCPGHHSHLGRGLQCPSLLHAQLWAGMPALAKPCPVPPGLQHLAPRVH